MKIVNVILQFFNILNILNLTLNILFQRSFLFFLNLLLLLLYLFLFLNLFLDLF